MENKLSDILLEEGIRKSDLIRITGLASSTISKTSNNKILPSPVTQSKIVNGINEIIGKKKYTIKDVFLSNN